MTVHDKDIQRLSKLLGMTGSAHDGEALAAARKANGLLRQLGLSWTELLSSSEPAPVHQPGAHHFTAERLLQEGGDILTDFERKFLIDILAFETLSDKQTALLQKLKIKVAATGGS